MIKYAIIVAGGSGTRMGAPMPKQYLLLNDQPVLMHTLRKFAHAEPEVKLILVIPENDFELWGELCDKHNFQIPHHLVAGGKSRFQSVRNGLKAIEGNDGIVAIHDGVRPFVQASVINESYAVAATRGSAIAVIALKDSVRKLLDDGKSVYQERQYFRLVQTPQTFQLAKIKKAFEITELHTFTDDATVYEHQGWQVTLIAGNPENIKLTTPEDMDYASFLLSR
ncbi:2-C-methyl-D-erythritol 4-phosphate cytidylyltransferase [Belliella kenyensis]|uniref:2-C-methyl-D-erythritol 4-phosphate cytidylyltransferase n=1 Tax=Belliella kenyensis TaxID=1472724 RepID=A0ABV8EHC0_9BACT|nr:2-C-methyl-D-erythritol 4-phosphate cytidylyltransferase [Belliella kenyensis]MCH7403492.1 2-C-methyl-D-erythritol 4-phosphate cytidylyltransferase [Belliella kenyensis]MDN3602391.1 2-C-methyl-D-erythritol 4-phosphate cytidylyltransferase [Belliella kenyensis]